VSDRRLTSTRVAEILGVTASSVKRWADEGLLACERTAGGHRRFQSSEVARFRETGATTDQEALTPSEFNQAQNGVVGLDDVGTILSYNRRESEFSGLEPSVVVGRNFFTDIAPCCNNSLIFGAFQKGIAANELNLRVPYTFTYRVEPTNVVLHLSRDHVNKTNWLIVEHL